MSDLPYQAPSWENMSLRDSKSQGLWPDVVENIVNDECEKFSMQPSVTHYNRIPRTDKIPIQNPLAWIRVDDVIACFVDMEGSTKLSASNNDKSTARCYRLFTNTAVQMFHIFGASYIDIKGDGVFALYNSDEPHKALAATVSFKTFVARDFTPRVKKKHKMTIGGHFGIDCKTVLVRKMGLKTFQNRTDRQNEVWAGKPVNMAAKLASRSTGGSLLVSDRFYKRLKSEKAIMSCGCGSETGPTDLWSKMDLTEDGKFDFDLAYELTSNWCPVHGKEYCSEIAAVDDGNKS